MALYSDFITPAEVTGFVRASLADYEATKGSLARWVPNVEVADVAVRFFAGQAGLVQEAQFRAYDAEPEVGKSQAGKRVTIDLPAIGQEIPISEFQQLRERNASDEAIRNSILRTSSQVARAVADRMERMRGTVLVTGKATINQSNFVTEDDFGRDASMAPTAPNLWSDPSADRLGYLETLLDLYRDTNGDEPGSMVVSNRVARSLAAGQQFSTQLVGGGTRPATQADVQAILAGAGLPPVTIFDRRTSGGRVIPDDRVLLLPAEGPTESTEPTELGGTFWGQTLTASDPAYALADEEMPGIVVGVYKNEKPPMIAEVVSDAIALPVLGNANLALCAKVL